MYSASFLKIEVPILVGISTEEACRSVSRQSHDTDHIVVRLP